MRFIKRLVQAYREAAHIGDYSTIADAEGAWQSGDCHLLAQFLASETGKRLSARLQNIVFRSAIGACAPNQNGDYERGIARGIMLGVKALDQHIDVSLYASEEEDFTSDGAQSVNSEEFEAVPAL